MKYVHNLGCFAARLLWSYSLGNPTLRTSASWIWIQNTFIRTHDAQMCIYIYQNSVYLHIYISLEKIKLSKKMCMYGEIRNKQGIERCKFSLRLRSVTAHSVCTECTECTKSAPNAPSAPSPPGAPSAPSAPSTLAVHRVHLQRTEHTCSATSAPGAPTTLSGVLSLYLSTCLSIYLSLYLSIYLSTYLSMYACMHACMHVCTHVLYWSLFLVVCFSICSLSN